MHLKLNILFVVFSAFATLAFGFSSVDSTSAGYIVPSDAQTIHTYGSSSQAQLPKKFKVLNWNIEKAKQGEAWANDFFKLQAGSDLIFIQEAVSDPLFTKTLMERKLTEWNYFVSWIRTNNQTSSGLVIGSHVKALTTTFSRTQDLEPVLDTPKLSAYQTYQVQGLKNTELLVINIHAINFVSTDKFSRHIQQVMDRIDAHQGPVLFAGDMNTWNKARRKLLMAETTKRNLVWYDFERPEVEGMHSKLDHVFVRGLKVTHIKLIKEIRTSDHFPIEVELEVQ